MANKQVDCWDVRRVLMRSVREHADQVGKGSGEHAAMLSTFMAHLLAQLVNGELTLKELRRGFDDA